MRGLMVIELNAEMVREAIQEYLSQQFVNPVVLRDCQHGTEPGRLIVTVAAYDGVLPFPQSTAIREMLERIAEQEVAHG